MIDLPFPDPTLSPNARCHWAAKAKAAKAAKETAYIATLYASIKLPDADALALWVTFYPPDRRARDDDNLISAFKNYRDGIAQALQIDDKRFRVIPFLSDEVRKGGQTLVKITTMPEIPNER